MTRRPAADLPTIVTGIVIVAEQHSQQQRWEPGPQMVADLVGMERHIGVGEIRRPVLTAMPRVPMTFGPDGVHLILHRERLSRVDDHSRRLLPIVIQIRIEPDFGCCAVLEHDPYSNLTRPRLKQAGEYGTDQLLRGVDVSGVLGHGRSLSKSESFGSVGFDRRTAIATDVDANNQPRLAARLDATNKKGPCGTTLPQGPIRDRFNDRPS